MNSPRGRLTFGPWSLSRERALLRFRDASIDLPEVGSAILAALVEQAGAPLTPAQLLAALQRPDVADTQRLWDAVAALNRALAEHGAAAGFVAHLPQVGFSLVLPPHADAASAPAAAPSWSGRRPMPIFGRAGNIQTIVAQLAARRFVTIVGPGGMGKTTLARATADTVCGDYADGVCLVDLAPVADARLVPDAIAAALGVTIRSREVDLRAYLGQRQVLVILDSCEHVVEAAAAAVESFLSDAPRVHVLATSREPLRAMGEWLHPLEPMPVPQRGQVLTAAQTLRYPGVQLFVERARARLPGFVLDDALAASVADLCRRLDGIALAIELAAARAGQMGVRELAAQVGERLLDLGRGPRDAPARHRTLESMLDWSYDLLAPAERRALRCLSVFRGSFSLAAARAVVDGDAGADRDADEVILDLVAKSLVASSADGGAPMLRLLDTTRAYAAAKLALDQERAAVQRRHAQFMHAMLVQAESAWERMSRNAWCAEHALWINDVVAALGWAFSSEGDAALAVRLTCVAFALSDQTGLMGDFNDWIQPARRLLPELRPPEPLLEMRLSMLPAFIQQRRAMKSASHDILAALAFAQTFESVKYQAGPLSAAWAQAFQAGAYDETLPWTTRMTELARSGADRHLAFIASRTGAQTAYYLGRFDEADRLATEVLAGGARRTPLEYFPSPVDPRVSMTIVQGCVLLLRGRFALASRVVEQSLVVARDDTPMSMCQTLGLVGVPEALWRGDLALARERLAHLRDQTSAYRFDYWLPWLRAFDQLLAAPDDAAAREALLAEFSAAGLAKLLDHLVTFDERWLSADTQSRVEAGRVGWCAAEVLRARGEAARAHGRARDARALFERARDQARAQGALAWELRAQLSLVRLQAAEGRADEATAALSTLRRRFDAEARSADLREADAFLGDQGA